MEQIHRVIVDTISFCWTLLRALTALGLWRSHRKWVSRGCLKYLPKCSMFLRVETSQLLPMVKRDDGGMLQNDNAVRSVLRNTMKCRVWFDVETNFQLLPKLTQFAFRKHKEGFRRMTQCAVCLRNMMKCGVWLRVTMYRIFTRRIVHLVEFALNS